MKWGTMARLAKIGVTVVVVLIMAGPALGFVNDVLKNGSGYEAIQIGTDAVYELRTMDEATLQNNLRDVLNTNSGPLTIEYGDEVVALDKNQVDSLAKTIIHSTAGTATVKDSDGNIAKQNAVLYGNKLETGSIIDIKLGKLTQGLDMNMAIEYKAKGVVIPVQGTIESKDDNIRMDVCIPEICEALIDALGGERILNMNVSYISTLEIDVKKQINKFDSTYECIKVDRGFRIDVKSSNSYGDFTADLDADVDLAIATTSDGFSITFTNGFSNDPVSKGIEKYIENGITISSGNDKYEMDAEIAQGFLELIKILEAEAK